MLEKRATEGIDIRPWIFYLSDCAEDARDGIEAFPCEITDIIVFDVGICELLQMQETGIRVPQNRMPVSRDNLSFTERLLHVFLDDPLARFLPLVVGLQLGQPLEAFLVGKPMQWASEAIHRC